MTGVQLGGIDPAILRELSGVYKPFVKALKELVSNAFDADADHVHITLADDFASITVTDDGEGMTPFEFRNDFTRIGGGSRRWLGDGIVLIIFNRARGVNSSGSPLQADIEQVTFQFFSFQV